MHNSATAHCTRHQSGYFVSDFAYICHTVIHYIGPGKRALINILILILTISLNSNIHHNTPPPLRHHQRFQLAHWRSQRIASSSSHLYKVTWLSHCQITNSSQSNRCFLNAGGIIAAQTSAKLPGDWCHSKHLNHNNVCTGRLVSGEGDDGCPLSGGADFMNICYWHTRANTHTHTSQHVKREEEVGGKRTAQAHAA